MAQGQNAVLFHQLRALAAQSGNPLSDRELLLRFITWRDEEAFAALVRRHGPMIHGVCRRILPRGADADDAFQATFLVLHRRAANHSWHDSIGGWLHGVAVRVALQLRAEAARRADLPSPRAEMVDADPLADMTARELLSALDEELARLPGKYRAPLVSAYLEGRTQEEAARHGGWSLSTFRRRLEQGRRLLHSRLTRRGLTLSATFGAVLLSRKPLSAALARETTRAVLGKAASVRATALAEGVFRTMAANPVKAMAVLLLAVGMLAAGVGLTIRGPVETAAGPRPEAQVPAEPPAHVDLHGDPLPREAVKRLGTLRFRSRVLTSLDWTPDGEQLVATGQCDVVVFDAASGKEVRRMGAELPYFLGTAVLSSDGRLLAVQYGGANRGSAVLEVATGRVVCRCGRPAWIVTPACFSPDGKVLAAHPANLANMIELYDTSSGALLRTLQTADEDLINSVEKIAFLPDGNTLVSAAHDGVIRFWEAATGKEIRRLDADPRGVARMALSPDGSRIAFAACTEQVGERFAVPDNHVHIWATATGKEEREIVLPRNETTSGPSPRLLSLAFTSDGRTLLTPLSGSPHAELRGWDVATGKELPAFAKHRGYAIALSPDGRSVAGVEHSTTVTVRDLATARDLTPSEGHRSHVSTVAFSPDGRTVATGGNGGVILWDATTGRERRQLIREEQSVRALTFSANGSNLYAVHFDEKGQRDRPERTLVAWDPASGQERWRLAKHASSPAALALSPDGKVLAAAGEREVILLDAPTGRLLRSLTMPAGDKLVDRIVRGIALGFTPDGRFLRASGDGEALHQWDVATGEHTRRPCAGIGKQPFTMALTPDGTRLAIGGWQRYLMVADTATGKEVVRIPGSDSEMLDGAVFALAFSPDGKTLAWAGPNDGAIHLVEAATGRERHRLSGFRGRALSLAFSADGRRLLSGGDDSTALVWDLTGG